MAHPWLIVTRFSKKYRDYLEKPTNRIDSPDQWQCTVCNIYNPEYLDDCFSCGNTR